MCMKGAGRRDGPPTPNKTDAPFVRDVFPDKALAAGPVLPILPA